MVPRCEIKRNFGISYAHINVNDHTKVIIYNYAYKYNIKVVKKELEGSFRLKYVIQIFI